MGRFKGISGPDLYKIEIPQKEFLVSPILETNDLMLLYSSPGVGKTLLAGKIAALAASGGSSMGIWDAKEKASVFYLDTEMHIGKMKARLEEEFRSFGIDSLPSNLVIFSQQLSACGNPNICLEKDRLELMEEFQEVDLIVIDSLSNVFRTGDDNLAYSWGAINEWLKELRKKHTVIVTHHANKSKGVRGSSKIEDPYDTIWYLGNSQKEDGKAFFVESEKNRNNLPGISKRLGFQRTSSDDGIAIWKNFQVKGNPKREEAMSLYLQGMSQKDIASAIGVQPPAVSKYLRRANEQGLLSTNDEDDEIPY